MSNQNVYKIASNGIVAAIYFVLTIISTPFAFGQIQIRIAEALIFLCFFRRDFVFGVTLGCFLSNLASPLGYWDLFVGTGATLISSLLVAHCSPWLLVATIYPIVINAFAVGWELNFVLSLPFWESVLFVAIGESIAIFLGYFFFLIMKKRKGFFASFKAERHLNFKF